MQSNYRSNQRYLILNLINHLGPISRTKITALLDYRPASVGAIIKELLDEQLLVMTGSYSAGLGRKRALLSINEEHICAIAIGFTSSAVTFIVHQFNGGILEQIDTPINAIDSDDALAEKILAQTLSLVERFPNKLIVGIGLCEPLYDPTTYRRGSVLASYTHFNDWVQQELTPRLEALTALTVSTFNGVTLPAMAEQRFGVAKDAKNFFCVELSNGIGSSLYCNGRAVAGASGVAGELGHTVVDAGRETRLCYCGKAGCVERDTAFPALARDILGALRDGVSSALNTFYDPGRSLTVQDVRRALDEGDQLCMFYVKRSAEKIGLAIANAVNLLNPELIVLHGFMLELGDYFIKRLETSIRENTLTLAKQFDVRISPYLESNLSFGAAAEMFSSYLKIDDYKWVYQFNAAELEGENQPETEEEGSDW